MTFKTFSPSFLYNKIAVYKNYCQIIVLFSTSLTILSFFLLGYHPIYYGHVHIWDHSSCNTALFKKVLYQFICKYPIHSTRIKDILKFS